MGTENIISEVIPEETITQIKDHLTQCSELLKPYVVALTPDQRSTLPKMSDKTLSFVDKVLVFSAESPQFNPPYLDVDELHKDFDVVTALNPLKNVMEQLYDNTNATIMLAGSEAYMASLIYYHSVKHAAKIAVPGSEAIYDDLKVRFPGRKTATQESENKEENKEEKRNT